MKSQCTRRRHAALAMTALTLAMLWPQAHAQTAEQAAAAALMGQGGVNMDAATLQNLNISNLPAGLAGKLPGSQSSLPVLTGKPDLGAQDAALRQGRLQSAGAQAQAPEAPNQFQRFVQQSTGRLLPIFGANLFDNPQAVDASIKLSQVSR